MENDSISPSSSESKLPLIVGILAFALGAAGLVLGLKAKGAAEAASVAAADAAKAADVANTNVASKATKEEVLAVQAALDKSIDATNKAVQSFNEEIEKLQKLAAKPVAANGKAATPPGPGEHAVAKGETLSGIAKKAGISLKALQDLNPGVDATKLRIGQKLKTK
jgi:LysM repeat protein